MKTREMIIRTQLMKITEKEDFDKYEVARDILERKLEEHQNDWSYTQAHYILDDFINIANLLGFEIKERHEENLPRIYYKISHSEEDGVSFEAIWKKPDYNIVKKIKEYAPKDETLHQIASELDKIDNLKKVWTVVWAGKTLSRCHCINLIKLHIMDAEIVPGVDSKEEFSTESYEESIQIVLNQTKVLANWLYNSLLEDYKNYTNEENIKQEIIENNYWFDAEGNMYTDDEITSMKEPEEYIIPKDTVVMTKDWVK